ncbi:hypothetical protein A1O1_08774 [Capronia coronata CBS 617.96]|uniref:Uncharacterized protein n=1 Tax=Capronia coronata CBS 617.96 TaxID=1182541 RepID=W9XQB0_9EURO|nr:uncharacterized protein A1O1_08774 [Capronia coronata CBS 617.96]EXJ79510.1 hypothetical protein A1O1_08774 [Capronia coronata CBS 617.96]
MAVPLQCSNYPGYEIFNKMHGISSGVVIPPGSAILFTAGMVGPVADGGLEFSEDIEDQFQKAFQNCEKAIRTAAPSLSAEDAWKSIVQITSYHVGGVAEVDKPLAKVAGSFLRGHQPGWTAVTVPALGYPGCKFEFSVVVALPPK